VFFYPNYGQNGGWLSNEAGKPPLEGGISSKGGANEGREAGDFWKKWREFFLWKFYMFLRIWLDFFWKKIYFCGIL
jgi:hypothetical protein